MPNIKAAEKWVRQSNKRTQRNLDTKSRLKTLFKKAVGAADAEQTTGVESQYDKAAQKGIIHPNKAARKKSRLARAIKAATAAPAKAVKRKGGAKKSTARKTTKKAANA